MFGSPAAATRVGYQSTPRKSHFRPCLACVFLPLTYPQAQRTRSRSTCVFRIRRFPLTDEVVQRNLLLVAGPGTVSIDNSAVIFLLSERSS